MTGATTVTTGEPSAEVEPYPCGPAPDDSDRRFWEGLREGRLVLPRCAECDRWRPPKHVMCAHCWSFATTWQEVRQQGVVHTWIRTHRDFMSELDVAAPYVTALVALDDAPLRLLGIVTGADGVAIGDRLVGTIVQPDTAAWPLLRWAVAS